LDIPLTTALKFALNLAKTRLIVVIFFHTTNRYSVMTEADFDSNPNRDRQDLRPFQEVIEL
jgi:hypothetical protein